MHITILMLRSHLEHYHTTRITSLRVRGCGAVVVNEREEFMQETQHTQQTATRTAQN